MPHMDETAVHSRAAAIAAALGGAVTDLTTHSALIGFPDEQHEGLRVMLRFRTYGAAAGKGEASAYMPACNGRPSRNLDRTCSFGANRPPEAVAKQIMTKLLGPDALTLAREIKAQRAKINTAMDELRAKLGALTDAYPGLRARLSGDTASFTLSTEAGLLAFNMEAPSDDIQITHGWVDWDTLIALLDRLTGVSQ